MRRDYVAVETQHHSVSTANTALPTSRPMADDLEAPVTEAPAAEDSAPEAPDPSDAEALDPDPPAEAPVLSPFLQAVRAPISASNPVGDDVKYEDSFQQLKTEVDKVQSAGADADFDRIVELGRRVLTTQSKDLTVAAYLGLGLVRTQGIDGVAESAEAVRILCETFWEDLYPPTRRMVARKNALQLLIDRTLEWVEPQKPTKSDGAALDRALEGYKAIQALATEKMGEDAPVLSRIVKLLEAKVRAVPKDAPPPPPSAAGPAADGAAPRPAGATAGATADPAELRSPTQAGGVVLSAAAFLRQHNKTDPTPFRLVRALRWGALAVAPPSENGKTLIPPFIKERKTYLSGLLDRAQFAELADETEKSFPEQPFWLDLQRYLVTAMDALGTPFAVARDAVVEDIVGLIRRFPDLGSLTFSDGAPFADAATQEWIEVRIRPALQGGGGNAVRAATDGEAGEIEVQYAEARKHLAKGDLAAAVTALGEGPDASGRDRFRRRLYLAALCTRGGRPAVARPLLEQLDAEIDAHRLDTWAPGLALEVWTALHGCYGAIQRSAPAEQKIALGQAADRVFDKVCAADPSRALAMLESSQR